MIKRILLIAAVVAFAGATFTTPAQAAHCPKDVKKINAAISKLSKEKMMMGKEMSAKGLALHKAGKHGESLKVLHEALEALGIKH